MPILTVIAGPNGAGKSTLAQALDFDGRENLLEPDAIARRINPLDPGRAGMAAGRELLRRLQSCFLRRVSFAIETTLASKRTLETMQAAKAAGFQVDLIYVGMDTPERCVLRVQQRVLRGGHDVPDEDIRRRYLRSTANLLEAIQIADRAILYDNSEKEPRKVLEARFGSIVWSTPQISAWVAAVRCALPGPDV